MADDDQKKPWYLRWLKPEVLIFAVPSLIAALMWIANAIENRGIALAGKDEVDTTLAAHGQSIQAIQQGMTTLDTHMQLIGQQEGQLIDGQKKESDATDKILWYLIDARKQSTQSRASTSRPDFEAQAIKSPQWI